MQKPPYQITPLMLERVAQLAEAVGLVRGSHLYKPPTALRKKNRIKTIQGTLQIEGNTLSVEQITAILNNQRVLAPAKDLLEVQNAITVYDQLGGFNPYKLSELERAHGLLMQGLVADGGHLRSGNVGIVKGSQLAHMAPAGSMVRPLMKNLFEYLENDRDLLPIKSCVFHYELEFIHPFSDGNGRMGRLWQTLLLMQYNPVFEYLPVEQLILKQQREYYASLAASDRQGQSTPFIEFMLGLLVQALEELLKTQAPSLTAADRLALWKEKRGATPFSRKDYLQEFKQISAPTASRDLRWGVDQGLLQRRGEQRQAVYWFG